MDFDFQMQKTLTSSTTLRSKIRNSHFNQFKSIWKVKSFYVLQASRRAKYKNIFFDWQLLTQGWIQTKKLSSKSELKAYKPWAIMAQVR